LLIIGFIPGAIAIYFFGPGYIVLFVFGNVGALCAGYLYTSRSFKMLFKREVIR
jgi:uncharacterized membrane protein YeaQ/YmgE (transglycosylase-associated protein family)